MNTAPQPEHTAGSLEKTVAVPAPRGRLGYLDGIRALAALYVLMHHAVTNIRYGDRVDQNLATDLLAFPHDAVVLFLVLSGCCLALPVVRAGGFLKNGAAHFLIRRAWRILPPYLASMVLCLVLIGTIIGERTVTVWNDSIGSGLTLNSVWLHLVMLHDAIPYTAHQINYVFWSISVEWRIYFLFPLFLWLWRRCGPVFATVGIVIGSLIAAYLMPIMSHGQLTNMSAHFAGVFAIGMLAATIGFSARKDYRDLLATLNWRKWCGWCLVGYIALCMVRMLPPFGIRLPSMLVDVAVALCGGVLLVWCAHCSDGFVPRLLANSLLVRIGGFSYSLYLIHPPILQIVWKYLAHPLNLPQTKETLLMSSVGATICVVVAYGFYLLFERPFLDVGKRKADWKLDKTKCASAS